MQHMMERFIIVGCIILLSSLTVKAQHGDSYRLWYTKAEKLFNLGNPSNKTDSVAAGLFLDAAAAALQLKDGKIAVSSLIKAATIRQTYKQFDESITLYRRSLAVNEFNFRDTALLYEAWLYLGSAFYQQGQTDSAKYYFERASFLSTLQPETTKFPEQERLYNSLGAIYYESANYSQAMNYFQKALQYDDDEETRVTLESNVANCLVQLSRYNEGLQLFNSLLPSGYLRRITFHNLGHAYFKIGKYDSAVLYFNKVSRETDDVTIRMLSDLGKIQAARHDHKAALNALDSSLNIINTLSGKMPSSDRAMNYLIRSVIAGQLNQNDNALKWCEDALNELLIGENFRNDNIISPVLMLDVLKQKATLLERKYRTTHSATFLENCFRTWQQAVGVATYIRKYLDNDEAKMYFQQGKGIIFFEAIRVGFEWIEFNKGHQPVNDIIGIMEAYKGSVLLENIKQASSKAGSNIGESIRQQEKVLRQSISYYTIKLGTSTSSSETRKLQQQILSARVQLSRLQKQYELHPEYDFYKEDTCQVNYYGKLAAMIDNNTALLSYMQSGENIYALALTSKSFSTHVIKISPELKNNISSFISEVYHHTDGKRYEGSGPSHAIYRQLIGPFEGVLRQKEKLVILPDGMLNYIPFDALATSDNNRDYLLLHKEINYHYSVSLMLYNLENPRTNTAARQSLFLAPFATAGRTQTAGMSLLPFSLDEMPGFKVTNWVGEKATKKNLLDHYGNARVIHLATHATSGSSKEGGALIYLYPTDSSADANNLYLEEIYSMDLRNTDLVILSACETAGGINAAGEGLLSLSRGFMYAGSKGMISTLWKTEDQVSAKLMQFLYAEMNEGYPAEEALQRAKLRFLNDNTISEKYKTPNYWSNFIYVGQTGKKVEQSRQAWLHLLVLGSLGLLIFLVYKIRKLPRHSGVASVVEP
jgi:CHAT domain-containing protein/predicted negative regulator of RcsB-dependent stress response